MSGRKICRWQLAGSSWQGAVGNHYIGVEGAGAAELSTFYILIFFFDPGFDYIVKRYIRDDLIQQFT